MKNIETPSKKHLASIINGLREGSYVIPDFQREFEWSPGDVTALIRSIFEDYYIGTLLLWRATKENLSFLRCEPLYGYAGDQNPEHIVLDGQQRLSALYYAIFAPDLPFPRRKSRYLFYIDIEKLLAEEYDEAFSSDYGKSALSIFNNRDKQFSSKKFPMQVFGESGHAWLKWLEDYEKYWNSKGAINVGEERSKLEKIFGELLNEYDISFIELDREISIEKVCDIFTRINSTGIKLDIYDLLNALLRPKEINLKEMWRSNISRFALSDPDRGKLFVLQTMSILKQEYCAPKYLYFLVPQAKKKIRNKNGSFENIILIETKEEFYELWDKALENNLDSLKKISNPKDYGAVIPKFIPYATILPIFTVLNIEKGNSEYQDKKSVEEKIHAWYWSSIFTTHYSSAVESKMTQDLREMRRWFKDDAKVPNVVRRLKRLIEAPDFFMKSSGSAEYKGIFCLLAKSGAKDFFSWELPEYSELDDHHIVPRSWGKKHAPQLIDSILNRTPISDATNRKIISDKLPNVYFREMAKNNPNGMEDVYELLSTHLIPKEAVDVLLKEEFSKEDFETFLYIREKAITEEIRKLVSHITIDVSDEDIDYEEVEASGGGVT